MIRWQSEPVRVCHALGTAIALLCGCSGDSGLPGPTGTVSGNASYREKPIPAGSTIVFCPSADGHYRHGRHGRER